MGKWEEGSVGGGGDWAVGGGLNPLLGLFELDMSPRSASHRPKHTFSVYGLGDVSLTTGNKFRPMPSI